MFSSRSFLFLWIALGACDPASETTVQEYTPAVPLTDKTLAVSVKSGRLQALSYRKAEDWMDRHGWLVGGRSTGPGPRPFSANWTRPEGKAVEVNLRVIASPAFRVFALQDIPADALWVEEGDAILTVECAIAETTSPECSRKVLDGLLERAADPSQPYAHVATPAQSWLLPITEITLGTHLVISPALTDKAIAGLDSLGFTGGRILTEQKVDIRAGSDSGFPQVTLIGKKEDASATVHFLCAHGTDKQFWPVPDAASLGESILIHEKCSVRVHVGEVLGGRSDKAAAETLLRGLLAFTPPH